LFLLSNEPFDSFFVFTNELLFKAEYMKASELRIGNQVYINGVVHKVTGADLFFISQNETFGVDTSSCNPIKLTEEMLLKSGFKFEYEKVLDRVYSDGNFVLYWNRQQGYRLFYHDKFLSIGIFYWHQLQNLYMDITGKSIFLP
jgi:hypothetical protein